jgi:hypothetical protein
MGRAPHAMGKIAKQIDPEAGMDLPEKPAGRHWIRYNRCAERFEHRHNIGTRALMRRLAIVRRRSRRRS